MRLSLALFMLGIRALDVNHTFAPDHLALVADFLNRCPYFHTVKLHLPAAVLSRVKLPSRSFIPINNSPAGQIVRGQFHKNFVTRQDANEILAHLSGNVRQNHMFVFELNPEHGVREGFDHRADDLYCILFRHNVFTSLNVTEE
jgi:hypothetical protein